MPRRKKTDAQPNDKIQEKVEFQPPQLDHPRLNEWVPEDDDLKFIYVDEKVHARFSDIFGKQFPKFEMFKINKKHYKERMTDVCMHINYFMRYYDTKHDFLINVASVKYLIDRNPGMRPNQFKNVLIRTVVTKDFVHDMIHMAKDLYTVNINTDDDGKYRTTPKITNEQAKMLLGISFAIRAVLPLCVHFSNICEYIVSSHDYIKAFDSIFMDIVDHFEKSGDDYFPIFYPLCRFVKYRLERSFNVDSPIWNKKKQLYGITFETVFQNMIHEVILVKSLYKIAYDRSVVSYIDGVVTNSYNHFRFENFKFKPIEIDADSGGSDSDDYLTHAESLEMSIYRIDESNQIINDVNNELVLKQIYERFEFDIPQEELDFYYEHCKINNLMQYFLHTFYSGFFHSSTAIQTITRRDTIKLLVILKKYLQAARMVILPQLVTAVVRGRFKENMIKNTRFQEKYESSDVYRSVIEGKFRYIQEIAPKENPIQKKLSTIINSSFILVDYDPEINGRVLTDVPIDTVMDEYYTFLSII